MSGSGHVHDLLQDYLDEALTPSRRREIEQHLQQCVECRVELEGLRSLVSKLAALPKSIQPPRDLWNGIQSRLSVPGQEGRVRGLEKRRNGSVGDEVLHPSQRRILRGLVRSWYLGAVAAILIAVVGAIGLWVAGRLSSPGWDVTRIEGTPRIAAGSVKDKGKLRVGQWLRTDDVSRAKIDVGIIGDVEVDPNTRLQLLSARPTDHRMALEKGTIHARIWAPPRLFFVSTPSAVAVDLGCTYTLRVDSTGGALLSVTSGWVELEHDLRESVVPAGAMCVTRPGMGPGTPYDQGASEGFRRSLMSYDFEQGGSLALSTLLAESRPTDAITLWHLLSSVDRGDRPRVYDRLASFVPVPPGVTREGVLRLDPKMMRAWQRQLNLDYDAWLGIVQQKKIGEPKAR